MNAVSENSLLNFYYCGQQQRVQAWPSCIYPVKSRSHDIKMLKVALQIGRYIALLQSQLTMQIMQSLLLVRAVSTGFDVNCANCDTSMKIGTLG